MVVRLLLLVILGAVLLFSLFLVNYTRVLVLVLQLLLIFLHWLYGSRVSNIFS